MEYTEEELKRWWEKLAKHDRTEILATMADKGNDFVREMAFSFARLIEHGRALSPKQLAAVRKWAK